MLGQAPIFDSATGRLQSVARGLGPPTSLRLLSHPLRMVRYGCSSAPLADSLPLSSESLLQTRRLARSHPAPRSASRASKVAREALMLPLRQAWRSQSTAALGGVGGRRKRGRSGCEKERERRWTAADSPGRTKKKTHSSLRNSLSPLGVLSPGSAICSMRMPAEKVSKRSGEVALESGVERRESLD